MIISPAESPSWHCREHFWWWAWLSLVRAPDCGSGCRGFKSRRPPHPFALAFAVGAPVAQLDRASDFGSEGWGFKSLRAHQFASSLLINSTSVLNCPVPPHSQLLCRMEWPIRVSQHLSSQQHYVRMSFGDDLFGLLCFSNQSHSSSRDVRFTSKRSMLFDESSTSSQGINMGVTPNAQVCTRDSAIGRDGCGSRAWLFISGSSQ